MKKRYKSKPLPPIQEVEDEYKNLSVSASIPVKRDSSGGASPLRNPLFSDDSDSADIPDEIQPYPDPKVGRIIVAEDQLHNITIIKDQLGEIGLASQCDFVFNGQEAVLKFSELTQGGQRVTHVLTDFMMPRLNGI